MDVNLQLLEEFVTLAVVKNFSAAAERLRISQPSLSRHIKALEGELGAPLVERTAPVVLTDAGRIALGMATNILSAYETARREIAEHNGTETGRGSLTIEDTFYCPCFSDFLYRYSRDDSCTQLAHLDVQATRRGESPFAAVLGGQLDLAFASSAGIGETPDPGLPAGLAAAVLPSSTSRVCFLVRRDNPLATSRRTTLADLARVKIMMPTMLAFEYERNTVASLFETYAHAAPLFDWREVATMQEFFSLDPGDSAFFTTQALYEKYRQYSTWVHDNTVPLYPDDAPYIRRLYLVFREGAEQEMRPVIETVQRIWASGRYYGE